MYSTHSVARMDCPVSTDVPIICFPDDHGKMPQVSYDIHYALELGIVLSGRMTRIWGSCETVAGPGDAWLCGMWEPHGYRAHGNRCRVLVGLIWPPFMADLHLSGTSGERWLLPFTAPPKNRPGRLGHDRAELLRLAQRWLKCLDEPRPQRDLWLQTYLLQVLLELTRGWDWRGLPRQRHNEGFLRISNAITLVHSCRRFIPVDEAAEACGMCRNVFSRVFKEVTGTAFPQFAMRYRISGAAGQLKDTRDPVKAIAKHWGFTDDSHLHRLFCQQFGQSPTAFREGQQKIDPT